MKITKVLSSAILFIAVYYFASGIYAQDKDSSKIAGNSENAEKLQSASKSQKQFESCRDMVLSLLINKAETEFLSAQTSIQLIAQTEEAKSCKWEKVKPLLLSAQKNKTKNLMWMANPDGSYYSTEKDLTDKNLNDREYFKKVLKGESVFGELVVGLTSGKKSFIIAEPVMVENKVVCVLGVSIYLEELAIAIDKAIEIPDDAVYFAVDKNAVTTLNFKPERIFTDINKHNSESLANAFKEMLEKKNGSIDYMFNDKKRKTIYKESKLTGWIFCFGYVASE